MEPKEIILPISDWNKYYQWPTVNGMRKRFAQRKEFGYESAFFKEGKRVLVRVNEFWKCLEKRGEKK
jgi:hypothetical protein